MKTLRALADLTRVFPNQLMIGAGVLIGEVVALSGLPPLRLAVLGFVGPSVLGASTFAMNDYYDLESDRMGGRRDRPLVRGDISPRTARNVFLVGFPVGLVLSSIINLGCLVIAVVFALLALAYNLRLKQTGLPGNLFIASTMAIPFIYGSVAVGETPGLPVIVLSLMAFLSGTGREVLKDVMDVEADAVRASRSIPRTMGLGFASRLSAGFFASAVALSPLPFFSRISASFFLDPKYGVPVALTDLLLLYVMKRSLAITRPSDAVPLRGLSLAALGIGLLGFLFGSF